MNRRTKPFDILCTGELLIDMISVDFADDFSKVEQFKRIQGGSPANLGMNMARLGNKVHLVAGVGTDDMGSYLVNAVKAVGLSTEHISRKSRPTSLILVTRSKAVSNFEAYRGADCQLTDEQFPSKLLQEIRVFHTTCFGLSKNPAQSSILSAAKKAHEYGAQLSIDLNYASKIWKDQEEAQKIVAEYCSYEAIIKVSEVDWERLYNTPLKDPKAAAQHFLDLGAKIVCVTLGSEGVWAISKESAHFLPSRPIDVKDTTGAGDAFWSGFLTAWLDGQHLLKCAAAGRNMAEFKIQHFGTLDNSVDKDLLYV